jgi:CRISPR/Cas system-associated exonuclease Cas4 (RecB family)
MLTLSASSLKDFLKCSKMFYYRITSSCDSVSTSEMIAGSIVHKIIEEHRIGQILSEDKVDKLISEYKLIDLTLKKRIESCLRVFFKDYENLISDKDYVEYNFRIPLFRGVKLTGRIDRITPDGILIDWKTGGYIPKSIDDDLQFIIYFWAYNKVFGRNPNKVFYIALLKNKILEFNYNPPYFEQLFDHTIPSVVTKIKNKEFSREGLDNNSCKYCSYMTTCWKDMENEK